MILKATTKKGSFTGCKWNDNSNLGADNVHKMIFTKVKLENPLVNKEKNYRA
jgi:hypothetical protein